ncbi:MAG TPA: ABATE domain-containing protein, partial [Gaiellales bacterium]|nr:ABATE domain-containing protein [Gaiellales bacterium]
MTDADPNPAPGSLLLVQEFVNTLDIEEGTDAIDTPERLRSWLVAHGLAAASARPSTGDVARAADVREGLRALLLANNGAPLDERAVRRLNRAAAEPHLRLRVAAG